MITIPRGKEVKIAKNGTNILSNAEGVSKDTRLVLASELTIQLHSEFSALLGDTSNAATKLIDAAGKEVAERTNVNINTKFREQGFQQWTGTDPIAFSFELLLSMRTSGKTDVLEPAKILINLPLPFNGGKGVGLRAPGPSISSALGGEAEYTRKYSFRCGIFYLPLVIFKGVEPTWSSEVDDEGYPTWCNLKVDVSSVFTATQNDINDFGYNYGKTGESTSSTSSTAYGS